MSTLQYDVLHWILEKLKDHKNSHHKFKLCQSSPLFPAPAPSPIARKALFDRSRLDTSLGRLTRRFAEMMMRSADGVLDLNTVAQELGAPKRRVYDVTNVLEGIQLIKKKSKNTIEWL